MPVLTRAIGLGLLCVLLGSCTQETAPKTALESPNVILISVDTLRADRLGCYGFDTRHLSPNIDALAADGILFENHISASPWTTPAHMSLLTSLYPSTHGINQSFREVKNSLDGAPFTRLPEARETLAEALAAQGYATAAFTGGRTLSPKIGFDQGFSRYETSMLKLDEQNMGEMMQWVESRGDEPFFLFFHTFEVHSPYLNSDFLPTEYAAAKPDYDTLIEAYSQDPSAGGSRMERKFLQKHRAYNAEVCEALYLGRVRTMDAWIGRLIADLKSQALYDKSLIVFTSDHGDEFADHDPKKFYNAHGHSVYEELIRIPLIVKLPKQEKAGVRVTSISRTVDIMPTVLEVCGIDVEQFDLQGDPLSPLWEHNGLTEKRIAYTEAAEYKFEIKSLRTDRYKYVLRIPAKSVARHGRSLIPDNVAAALFDLRADPAERTNLLASPQDEAIAALQIEYDARLRAFVNAQHGVAEEVQLDSETLKQLQSLGYID